MTAPGHPTPGGRLESSAARDGEERRFLLLEILFILAAWRRVIIAFAAGVVIVTVAYALLAHPIYAARASLVPQQEETEFGGLSNLVANQFGSFAGGLFGITTSTDLLMTLLESRRLKERVVDRLGLEKALGIRGKTPQARRETVLSRLERMSRIGLTKRLSVFVEVRAPSAALAADIANGYMEELDSLNRELSLDAAREKRMFLEGRLAEARDSLTATQHRLEDFQRAHSMIALDEQAKAEVEVAARLQGEMISLQAQLDVQKRYSSSAYSRTRDLEYRISALKNRIDDLMYGSSDTGASSGTFRSFAEIPGLGRELAGLMLDARTHEAVYTLLMSQYQQSRIEEARNVPTVQVLDRATPPPYRDSPRRKRSVLAGLMAGLGGGVLLAFGLEYLHRSLQNRRVQADLAALTGGAGIASWLERLRSA